MLSDAERAELAYWACSAVSPRLAERARIVLACAEVELDVHVACDNYATHKTEAIRRWLLAHPRFQLHFTPTGSSWLNLVERWSAELTNKKLRRGVHRSVQALERDIRAWVADWNDDPFIVTVSREEHGPHIKTAAHQ